MLLRIANFSGIAPQADPHLIANNQAQTAINCRFMGGVVNAYKSLRVVTADPVPGRSKSIYRFGQAETDEAKFWFTFNKDTDVAKSQIAADTEERTYFTDGVLPKKTNYAAAVGGSGSTYPHNSYQTSVPAPTATPVISIHTGDGSGTIRTEGQGAGSRIRFSHEPRSTKCANNTTRTDVEHVTGIPTGVAI